jgi:hypothetical protein
MNIFLKWDIKPNTSAMKSSSRCLQDKDKGRTELSMRSEQINTCESFLGSWSCDVADNLIQGQTAR